MKIVFLLGMFFLFSYTGPVFGETVNLITQGDQAVKKGDLFGAEKSFAQAAEQNPEGYRAIKSLAEIKVSFMRKTGKYALSGLGAGFFPGFAV